MKRRIDFEARRRITFEVPVWMVATAVREISGLAHVTGLRVETAVPPHLAPIGSLPAPTENDGEDREGVVP